MPWVTRGLRNGVLTTRYPARPDGYTTNWRGGVTVRPGSSTISATEVARTCPTGAIVPRPGTRPDARADGRPDARSDDGPDYVPAVDRGRCILCARCVVERPDVFELGSSFEVASLSRPALVVPFTEETAASLAIVRASLLRRVAALRRSVHLRHVDAGSDGSEEWEITALLGPIYDIHRLGIFFTASPRHADLLLVTGAGSAGMVGPLRASYEAMPDPRVVVAVGTDAISGGIISPSYATAGGVSEIVPVDVWVPGSPPSPFSVLHGILMAMGRLPQAGTAE